MSVSQKIVFFGTEDFSLGALQALLDAHFNVAAVVTKPDSKKGRGQKVVPPAVKVLADQHGIPVLQPTRLNDITKVIEAMQPVTGVLVSYGKIVPQSIIDLFTPGIINVHPSLLPRYRGPSPIESAIYNGDDVTGVSIMQLSAAMDAGPVYLQYEYPLQGAETKPELYDTLGRTGSELLVQHLPAIISGELSPQPQDDGEATYCHLLTKDMARVDPVQQSAAHIDRHVRAYLGYPKTKLTLGEHDVIITKAHVAKNEEPALAVTCKDGILAIDTLIAPSGRSMDGASFTRGYLS